MKDYKLPFLLIFLLFYFTINQAYSQDNLIPKGWGIGLSAGLINTNLASGGDFFFEDINPFLLNQDRHPSFRINIQYDFSPYESIRTDISTGKFSLITNFAGWPELTFTNDFITSSVSAQLSLMRYLGVPPEPLNIYKLFGIGINFNNISVVPKSNNNSIESQKTDTINPIFTIGGGLRLYVSSNVNFYTEYNLFVSDKQIIDSNFIRDNLNTDFTRTSSRWKGLQAGIQIKFHRKRVLYTRNKFISQRATQPTQPTQPQIFTEFFESIYVEEPSLDSLVAVNDISKELSRENFDRFNSHSVMTFPTINIESDVVSEYESNLISEFNSETDTNLVTGFTNEENNDEDILLSTIPSFVSEYGTTGEWNIDDLTGYTIIVHSLVNLGHANRVADELRQSGYRVSVIPSIVNNTNHYRVAIGQYETRYRAIQAANHLPPPIKSQYFIISLP